MSRNNHRTIAGLSREELQDKHLRLYDEHQELKKTARLQEDRIKRLAAKIVKLANDKKKLQRSASGGVGGAKSSDNDDNCAEELNERIDQLEKENNALVKKLDEYKQLYYEQQKKGKVTARIDSGILHPSAGPPVRSSPSRSNPSSMRRSLRRVEAKSESRLASGSKSGAVLDLEARLAAAVEENNNMFEAVSLLQRKIGALDTDNARMKRQVEQKNEMLHYTSENTANLDKDYQTELVKCRKELHRLDRANKTLELRMSAENSKCGMLETKLETEHLAHQSALDELDHAQKNVSLEMQKVTQLQVERRQMMTLKEEIQLEKETRRDLANENTLIKEQLDRILKADQTGSQIWRDREGQYQKQIAQLEQAVGADASDLQRLRLDLHKEKMSNKRLTLKLDELEAIITTSEGNVMATPAPSNKLDATTTIKEVDLNVITSETGNNSKELEIAVNQLRRRNKQLEEKLATLYRQLEEKDVTLRKMHSELSATITSLDQANFDKANVIDHQNAKINELEGNVSAIAESTYVPSLLQSKEHDYTGLATGDNAITISLGECTILRNVTVPKLFATIELGHGASKAQTTAVLSGLSVDFNANATFKVTVDASLLDYIGRGFAQIELHEVIIGTQHRLVGCGRIPLAQLLTSKAFSGRVEIEHEHESIAGMAYQVSAQIPLDNAAGLHQAKLLASGFQLEKSHGDEEGGLENSLVVKILKGEGFESAFEDELPSCYCLYTFYIHQNQRTAVVKTNSSPQWKYRAEHRVEQNSNLHRYLQSDKLKIIICDADDDGEDKADYLCCGDIELAPLAHNQKISRIVAMNDPDGDYAGNLFVTLKWKTPYKKRSVPLDPPLPIVTSTTLLDEIEPAVVVEEAEAPMKKKNSARETLESYFNERQSDHESLVDREKTPSPVSNDDNDEAEYTTPPPKTPDAPSLESMPPTPVPLDQTLDSIPDPIEEGNEPDTLVKEDEEEENEPVVEEEIDEEVEEDIQSGSVSFNVADDSGLSDTGLVATDVKEYTPAIITVKRLEAVEGVEERPNSTFVEYEFCGKVKETSASLLFPTIDKPALFDYSETFKFTKTGDHYEHLYSALLPHQQAPTTLKFTLVDDPGDEEDQDCQELGTAVIDIKQFIEGDNLEEASIPVTDTTSDSAICNLIVDIKLRETIAEIMADMN